MFVVTYVILGNFLWSWSTLEFFGSSTKLIIAAPHRELEIYIRWEYCYGSEAKNEHYKAFNQTHLYSTSNIRSSTWLMYKFAAIILDSKHTSLVTSGVTLGFPTVTEMQRYTDLKTSNISINTIEHYIVNKIEWHQLVFFFWRKQSWARILSGQVL